MYLSSVGAQPPMMRKVSSSSAGFALSMLSSEEYSKIEVLRG